MWIVERVLTEPDDKKNNILTWKFQVENRTYAIHKLPHLDYYTSHINNETWFALTPLLGARWTLICPHPLPHTGWKLICPNSLLHAGVQWNLWFKTTMLRDQPPMRDHFSGNLGLHFYTFIPPMKDHLSYKTSLLWSHGGFKLQVSLYNVCSQR